MQLRLYFDDDLGTRRVIATLREQGIDVIRSDDVGLRGFPDVEHLEYAYAQGRVLCSANRGDYARLHADWVKAGREHAGIVVMNQQQYSIGEQLRRWTRILGEMSAEDMMSRIEYLSGWGPDRPG